MYNYVYSDELRHHGILGMKWGVRRFQNKDGTLTAQGKQRYSDGDTEKKLQNDTQKKNKKKNKLLGIQNALRALMMQLRRGVDKWSCNNSNSLWRCKCSRCNSNKHCNKYCNKNSIDNTQNSQYARRKEPHHCQCRTG